MLEVFCLSNQHACSALLSHPDIRTEKSFKILGAIKPAKVFNNYQPPDCHPLVTDLYPLSPASSALLQSHFGCILYLVAMYLRKIHLLWGKYVRVVLIFTSHMWKSLDCAAVLEHCFSFYLQKFLKCSIQWWPGSHHKKTTEQSET